MAKFEAVFHPGEDDRLPEWCVVEWEDACTPTIGSVVWKTYDMNFGEEHAKEMVNIFQFEYNLSMYKEFA